MKERCLPSPYYSHSPIWYLLPFFLVQNISQWLNVTVCHHSCVRRKVLRQFCLTSPDKWEILVGNYFLGDIHCQDTKGKMVLEIVALSLPFLLVIQQERIKIPRAWTPGVILLVLHSNFGAGRPGNPCYGVQARTRQRALRKIWKSH